MSNWELTDEHKAQIPAWNERWKGIILQTGKCDIDKVRPHIEGLYRAANLDIVPVIPVLSPMMGAVVWAAARVFWERVPAARAATYDATYDSTEDATVTADGMLDVAASIVCRKLGEDVRTQIRERLNSWYSPYDGGSEWASWCCYLSFVRDVIGWQHESHANYSHYEQAAIHGAPRFLHHKFCLVSDFASWRITDGNGKLHSETGLPAIGWGCGTVAYYRHGKKLKEPEIPAWRESHPVPRDEIEWWQYADWLDDRGDEKAGVVRKELALLGKDTL